MPTLKSEISGTLKVFLGYNHTHNILQKWLAPVIVLNVSLQNYNTSSSTDSNLVPFFGVFICFENKKIPNPKGQMVTIVHFMS